MSEEESVRSRTGNQCGAVCCVANLDGECVFDKCEAKAKTFINKAQKQSAFINNIDRAAKSAKKKTADLSKNLKENLGKHKGVR